MRIVVIDPETLSGKLLSFVLQEAGHDVVVTRTATDGLDAVTRHEADAVILVADLSDMEGVALCAELRARHHAGPILVLGDAAETRAKLRAFAHGADDYVVTPYDPVEVAARVDVVARRAGRADAQASSSVLAVEDAELSLGELTVRIPGRPPMLLTPTEMRVLEVLMRRSPTAVTRDELVERVWGYPCIGETNRADVYLLRLRRKLEGDSAHPRYLQTIRGIGYAFRLAAGPSHDTPGTAGVVAD